MKSEPATILSVITAVITAGIGLAVAFGADITDEQRNAMLAAGGALVPVIALLGPVIRQFVVSPQTAAEAVIRAKLDVSPAPEVPEVKVAGGAYEAAVEDAGFRAVPPPVNP
jgi:hypothetical protein